ncbi:MAG: hypothetical protein RL477_453, partial [Pseudomonadota bacterium]
MPALNRNRARKTAPKSPRRKVLPKSVRTALRWGLPATAIAAALGGAGWIYASGHAERAMAAVHDRAVAL